MEGECDAKEQTKEEGGHRAPALALGAPKTTIRRTAGEFLRSLHMGDNFSRLDHVTALVLAAITAGGMSTATKIVFGPSSRRGSTILAGQYPPEDMRIVQEGFGKQNRLT
jgi:hypothetical protein